MPWLCVLFWFFFPQGLATVAMASFTRAGPTSRPLAFPARSGATRCASLWDPPNGERCSRTAFPKFPRARQHSHSGRAEQGTGCLHSWVHWCFKPSSILQSASSPSHGKMGSLSFWQDTERLFYLCLSLILYFVLFRFANNSRKNYTETLIQFVSSPKAPHLHRRTPQVFPELSDAENYCRNPGGENERPWCYTKDPSVTWEYCSVSPCGDGMQLQFMISATAFARCLHPECSQPHRSVLSSGFSQS